MGAQAWGKVHDAYLEALLDVVRLRVRRRVLWLRRHHWQSDPLDELRADVVTDERADRLTAEPPSEREAAFARTDPDAAALTHAIEETEQRAGEIEAELATLGAVPPLRRLCRDAALSDVERDAVMLALAVALDPSIGPLLGYVLDDPHLASVTPAGVAALFGHSAASTWDLLDEAGPLRRLRLLRPPAAGEHHNLVLESRASAFLRNRDDLDPAVRAVARPLERLPLAPSHRDIVDRLTRAARADGDAPSALINLVGGHGRASVAAWLASETDRAGLAVDARRLVAHPDPDALAGLLAREQLLLPALLYIDADDLADEHATLLAGLLERTEGLVVIGSRARLPLWREVLVQRLPQLTSGERAALWREAAAIPEDEAATLAAQFHLGPAGVTSAVADARALAGADGAEPDAGLLWGAARDLVGRDLGTMARRIEPAHTFDQLVLPEREMAVLHDLVAQVRHRPTVYQEWGYEALLPRGQGVTTLFTGPPGTGKTMAAEVLAGALGLDLYRIDLSAVVSKYIGDTEKNLRKVFDAAETGAAVLFFDEADALFGKRTEVRDSHDRHANVEVNYLLQRMEDYAGVAILATNRKGDLDPAFLRRIRSVVTFPSPDLEHRRRIWGTVLPDSAPQDGIDLDALARLEVAGGNIRNIALAGAFLAAADGAPLGMRHLMTAARREYRKIDKVATAAEFGAWTEEAP